MPPSTHHFLLKIMKVPVYNQKAEEIGKTELPGEIFEVEMNSDLVHQAVLAQQANQRRKIAKTKDRGEKRGGGRKPWRQKGTGRARAGSNRSPIWKGGGVTFGPTTERIFKKKITKKMRKKALFMVLSAKVRNNLLLVVDSLNFEKAKTKLAKEILDKLFLEKGSGLVALPKLDKSAILALRNIPKTATVQAKDLNVLDLLSYKYLVMPKEAIKTIKETFVEKLKIKNQNDNVK
jgi:large subunit ribosomal protein L4